MFHDFRAKERLNQGLQFSEQKDKPLLQSHTDLYQHSLPEIVTCNPHQAFVWSCAASRQDRSIVRVCRLQ